MQQTLDYPSDRSQETLVAADRLRELLVKIYVKTGMFQAEAELAVDRQIEADLRGIQSHGSRATPRYVRAIDVGDIDPRGQTLTIVRTPAMAVLDGGRNLGHVASTRAMQMAIAMAREVGTGTVGVKNSHHFGAASVYALMAAREGMIGYCTTSTGRATVAAYGSSAPAVANNAFAWAAPSRSGAPFCLDMACAATSWGKIDALKLYGQPMPEHWALDEQGRPTRDPAQAKVLLPAAGARGFGLAYQCSILAGPLVGGKMPLHKTRHPEAEDTEHFFYCLDVARFGSIDRFFDEIDRTANEIRALPASDDSARVILPGDLEWQRAADWARDGIPLHRDHVAELTALAAKYKVAVPW